MALDLEVAEETLVAHCKVCRCETLHGYGHPQLMHDERMFDIYNCAICGDSKSMNPSEAWLKIKAERSINEASR